MKEKSESTTPKLDKILEEAYTLDRTKKSGYFKKLRASTKVDGQYDETVIKDLYSSAQELGLSEEDSQLLTDKFQSKLSLDEKSKFICSFIAKNSRFSTTILYENISKFADILKTDSELNLFSKNAQNYIDKHPKMSAYDLQILQFVANDPLSAKLNSLAIQGAGKVTTPLAKQMRELGLEKYISMDATAFRSCIKESVRDVILSRAKLPYNGPQMMGFMGAQQNYTRTEMAKTASVVKKMNRGVCHSFAQLAADRLLGLMETGELPPLHLKMVSYQMHTYLLIGHESDDLADLSNCIIVDPWSVAMGHYETDGVYTIENYPYPDMTQNLKCCYDNQVPEVKQKASNVGLFSTSTPTSKTVSNTPPPTNTSSNNLASVLTGSVFTNNVLTNKKDSKNELDRTQQRVVDFLGNLKKESSNGVKKDFIELLIESVKTGATPPSEAVKLGALAFQARAIENYNDKYIWKGLNSNIDETLVANFADKTVAGFWKNYAQKEGLVAGEYQCNSTMVSKIINHLHQNQAHEFDIPSIKNTNTI